MRIAEFADVDSGSGFPLAEQGVAGAQYPFLKVSDMNLEGNDVAINRWNNSVSEDVRRRLRAKAFPPGTVIFPKIGAAIATNKKRRLVVPSCIDNNCMGVTGRAGRVDAEYLYYLFRSTDLSDFASSSNPPSIRKSEVEAWDVYLPPLGEQRRIADLLSRAENIVRMRREAEAKAREIIPALFLDMFGDPTANERGWVTRPLGDLAQFVSGGTPAKNRVELWNGTLPWVSPKDMKVPEIFDAEDHVSEDAPIKAGIKLIPAEAVLVVVRGMILAHTVPVAIARVPLTINQDMKALVLHAELVPEYLLWLLRVSQKWLLTLVTSAAHGTRKIDTSRLDTLAVPVPPVDRQEHFSRHTRRLLALASSTSEATRKAEQVFRSLMCGLFQEGLGSGGHH